jgi:serine/threonine protein phosphatase PrpC
MSSKQFNLGKATLQGNRGTNQDRCFSVAADSCLLLGLADGMGGHPKGEKAAQILLETCERFFKETPKPVFHPEEFLTRMLQKAHENITTFGYEQIPPIDPRTTAVVVLIQKETSYWAHVGDSRIYLFRNNALVTRTLDHSYVEHLRQQGLISGKKSEKHPQRNYVTRCLGGGITSPQITLSQPHPLQQGDVLLLCSDGLWSQTPEDTLADSLEQPSLQEAVSSLVEKAERTAAGESDNVTAIAMRWLSHTGKTGRKNSATPEEMEKTDAPEETLNQAIEDLKQAIEAFETQTDQEKQ